MNSIKPSTPCREGETAGAAASLPPNDLPCESADFPPPAKVGESAAGKPPLRVGDLRFLNRFEEVKHSQNRLPHWQQPGATYFVTFRLADSIPQQRLGQWSAEREAWLKWNPPPWSAKQQREYDERFTGSIERWLDEGAGECVLRDPQVRSEIERTLQHFDGERHWNLSCVVMPNHVHTLFALCGEWRLDQVLHTWKSYSARRANLVLQRQGELWQKDYFDRMIRDSQHFWRCARYIRRNPAQARVPQGEYSLFETDWLKRHFDDERSGGIPAAESSSDPNVGRLGSRRSGSDQ